jgi:hypothetical protein
MSRRIWLVAVLALALLVLLVLFLWSGPLSCGTAQTWSLKHRGCWPMPSAY